ncbi:MAG: hypothetical protein ACK4MF_04555 [Hyphomicrobiaceae bacterium]
MSVSAPPTMRVVKKEEKEAQLREHIAGHIALVAASSAPADFGGARPTHVYRLIVRSHQSPVVRALSALALDLAAAGIRIHALVAVPGGDHEPAWPEELLAMTEARSICDVRILDAHEQLWLGEETVWIGDCMRREPAKRDAYECYGIGCRQTAHSVLTAFNLLWSKGAAQSFAQVPSKETELASALETAVAALQANEPTPPIASTRH